MSTHPMPFPEGAKVVISPDQMRAWITLPRPNGERYTLESIREWLPQNGVVYGADDALIQKAINSELYDEMLEVAQGRAPVAAVGGSYVLKIEQKPFTGLSATGDGSLIYDDLSFLQEVQAGQVLAEIVPEVQAAPGITVTGSEIAPRGGTKGQTLTGSGFTVSEDGRSYLAPALSHVSIVNEQLVVTPLLRLASLSPSDGAVNFDGNVFIEGDVLSDAVLSATGSVFVVGKAASANITAGNNILFCSGLRNEGIFSKITAKGNVWGRYFESAEITAGGDVCANHITGCEVKASGRVSVLGGRATIAGTTLHAKGGVVAGVLGDAQGSRTLISIGLEQDFLDRYNAVVKKIDRVGIDIQALQQNIAAHERINRMRTDKGKNEPSYKEMLSKRGQSLSVLSILDAERTRMKRTVDQASVNSIVVQDVALPGVTVEIDTRTMVINSPMKRTRFRRTGETLEATASAAR